MNKSNKTVAPKGQRPGPATRALRARLQLSAADQQKRATDGDPFSLIGGGGGNHIALLISMLCC
ncbi:MAG: hypothetical protein V2I82_03085 [Halieaceae bacterium]|jgi:hypothetical protein|nr:hypothetical protein [Halieaceae bacterium]